ncbi:unnamed protein product [Cyprideis torosa]|uniref:Guanylate kinase n=1 Tax=Cyprideis torosa TaxID=163714 RepID=A0A7R8WXM8_9CRUS|nr:unnamed protein product [Cyprideis torosa]CAG0909294.1 unnamed protein product [Cyprideis torosa]
MSGNGRADEFWRSTALKDMSADQWERLCDGCGRCCLHKLEDEDSGALLFTRVACKELDLEAARCRHYDTRQQRVPDCLVLSPAMDEKIYQWLPDTCAYRLLWQGATLPLWHPLRHGGDRRPLIRAGISVVGLAISEDDVCEDELEDFAIELTDPFDPRGEEEPLMSPGTLFIVSAPSGAGKTSLVNALISELDQVAVSVSYTTRAKRPGESHGDDYFFVEVAAFEQRKMQGDFLEHAQVFDNFYGTSRSAIEQQLNTGFDVILEIDWQGAQQVRQTMPDTCSIFILPPSQAVLEQRLNDRGQDSQETISRRMRDARQEMSHYAEYDFVVINDDFKRALIELKSIFVADRLQTRRQERRFSSLIPDLIRD